MSRIGRKPITVPSGVNIYPGRFGDHCKRTERNPYPSNS